MQINTTLRFLLTHSPWLSSSKQTTTNAEEDVWEKVTFIHCRWECKCATTANINIKVHQKTKHRLQYGLAVPFLNAYQHTREAPLPPSL
jgi:hypothetical protein